MVSTHELSEVPAKDAIPRRFWHNSSSWPAVCHLITRRMPEEMRFNSAMDMNRSESDGCRNVLQEQLDSIERILLWLPRNEPRRPLLRAKLAETREHLGSSPGRDALLCIRARVRELRPSSLRTLLLKRIDGVCKILMFPDRGVWERTGLPKLAS
jgi:hypothetical protein